MMPSSSRIMNYAAVGESNEPDEGYFLIDQPRGLNYGMPKSTHFKKYRYILTLTIFALLVALTFVVSIVVLSPSHLIRGFHSKDGSQKIKILTFNIWYGGTQVNYLRDVADVVIASQADVVGLQEADANLHALSELTGLHYVDERRFIISRFPIFDSGSGIRTEDGPGAYAIHGLDSGALHCWIVVAPGEVIAYANTHLWWDPYGPDLVFAGETYDDVMAGEEAARGDDYRALAQGLSPVVASGVPLFLTGDFNSPSHLDWTDATVGAYKQIRYPFEWPASKALEDIGMVDSFRFLHSDPLAEPGITFTPGQPAPLAVDSDQLLDRIDFVYVAGADILDSRVVSTTPPTCSAHLRSCTASPFPWPSDHSAVLTTAAVRPVPTPALVAVTRRRVQRYSEDVDVCFSLASDAYWSVAIVRAGRAPAEALTGMYNERFSYRRCNRFGTSNLPAGEYDAVLLSSPASEELARVRFVVTEAAVHPSLAVSATTTSALLVWALSPGDRHDFIAVYAAGTVDVNKFLGMVFTGGKFSAQATVQFSDPLYFPSPLPPGRYDAVLMSNDQFVELARASFEIPMV